MAGKQTDVVLGELLHAPAFRDDVADVLMVLFETSLLVGNIGVTEKDISTAFTISGEFDSIRILELGTVVSKNDRESLSEETVTEAGIQSVEGFQDTFLVTPLQEDEDHEAGSAEEEREQALAGFAASFHGVHLDDLQVWMIFHEALKILIGPLVSIGLLIVELPLFLRMFLPFLIPHSSWKIDVPCLENTLVKVVIKRPAADRDLVFMDCKDVGERLAFFDQRRDKVIELLEFFCGHVDALAGINEPFLILTLCSFGEIEIVSKGTLPFVPAMVADIRKAVKAGALERDEQGTELTRILIIALATCFSASGGTRAGTDLGITAPDGAIGKESTATAALIIKLAAVGCSVPPYLF